MFEYYPERTQVVDFVEYAKLMYEGGGHILHSAWVDEDKDELTPMPSALSAPTELKQYAERWDNVLESLYDILYQVPSPDLRQFFGLHPLATRELKNSGTTRVDMRRFVLFLCEYGFILTTVPLEAEKMH